MSIIWQSDFTQRPREEYGQYILDSRDDAKSFLTEGGVLRVIHRAVAGGSPKAELALWGSNPERELARTLPRGTDLLTRLVFMFPKWPAVSNSKTVFAQFWQKKGLNPSVSFELVRNEVRLVRLWAPDCPAVNPSNRKILWRKLITAGEWNELEAFTLFSSLEDTLVGRLMVGLNGETSPVFWGPNCYGCQVDQRPSVGIYRPGARDGTVPAGSVSEIRLKEWSIEAI